VRDGKKARMIETITEAKNALDSSGRAPRVSCSHSRQQIQGMRNSGTQNGWPYIPLREIILVDTAFPFWVQIR
jgi:hypothetical protein